MKTTRFFLLLLLLTLTGSVAFSRLRHSTSPLKAAAVTAPRSLLPVRLHRLYAPQAGRVWEVYVKYGDQVRPGQLVAKLAVPLESAEKQQRAAAFSRVKQHYAHLLTMHAPAVMLAQARRGVVAAGQLVVETPKLYTFVFVEATTGGTITGRTPHSGNYLSDSSTVAIVAEPVPALLAAAPLR